MTTRTTPSEAESGLQAPSDATASPMTIRCNADHVLQALRAGGRWLEHEVASVNALNVFPVPDGDTGTNMSLTMRAALEEASARAFKSVSDLAHVLAHGALMGARGNSGVILSQILRGVARGLDGVIDMSPADLAKAFSEGAATAYKGVMKPVEGTILTVIREASEAVNVAATDGADIRGVLVAGYAEAQRSVARTPNLLTVLAEAGVVDAGGQGLTVILEGIVRYLAGEEIGTLPTAQATFERAHPSEGMYNYDTQFIITGTTLDVDSIRAKIAGFGDSVLVVGDERNIKVHVHSDHPGEVLDFGISQGQVSTVIIENMQLQYEEFVAKPSGSPETMMSQPLVSSVPIVPVESLCETGVVAVVSGSGLQKVFSSLGVGAVVPGGQTMNPSTQDILNAIKSIPNRKVIILPNNSNIILTAEQAKALSDREVVVVPTKTVPQGIAALLAFNFQLDIDANAAAMIEASHQVQTAEITRAVRSVQVNGLAIDEGQFIGLLNDQLVTAGQEMNTVVSDLYQRIDVSQYEIITIYYGEGITLGEAEALADFTRQAYPNVDVEVLDGGQAHYYYIISAE